MRSQQTKAWHYTVNTKQLCQITCITFSSDLFLTSWEMFCFPKKNGNKNERKSQRSSSELVETAPLVFVRGKDCSGLKFKSGRKLGARGFGRRSSLGSAAALIWNRRFIGDACSCRRRRRNYFCGSFANKAKMAASCRQGRGWVAGGLKQRSPSANRHPPLRSAPWARNRGRSAHWKHMVATFCFNETYFAKCFL